MYGSENIQKEMSFSKSKVSRFGSKQETSLLPQRTSATEFRSRSRDVSRTQSGKNGLISASFNEPSDTKNDALPPPGSLTEARLKYKLSTGRHSVFSSKIGRPNLHTLKKGYLKSKPESPEGIEGITTVDSQTTVESSRSGPPTSRIPTVLKNKSRANSVGNSRGSSFVGSANSSQKSLDFQKRNLEMQFNLKTKRLAMMRKDLIEKQKPAIELYKVMLNLRNKIKELDGKELPLEDLKVIEYPDIKVIDEKEKEAEEEKLKEMKNKLEKTSLVFMNMCRKILDEKCVILDKIFDGEGEWSQDELIKKIQHYKEETTILEGHIEGRLKEEEGKIKELIKEWFELVKINSENSGPIRYDTDMKLQETEHKLKQALTDLQIEKTKKAKEIEKFKDLEKELARIKEKLHEANKTIEEERTKLTNQKDRQTLIEQKLKSAKCRMKDAEMQRQESEQKLEEVVSQMKNFEEEWKSKEIYFESRHRELQQVVKKQKEEMEKLELERHSVDVRARDLCSEFESREQEYQEKIRQLEKDLYDTRVQKNQIEKEYDTLRVQSVNSEVYNEMHNANKKKVAFEDQENKSSTEIALWQELQETKSALKLAEEKLEIYAEEKNRFLETISENYKEDEATVNMTAQLVQKEELISSLILQNKKLQEAYHETQEELENLRITTKTLGEKNRILNEQLYETDEESEKHIYELHAKLKFEINRNNELEQELGRANNNKRNVNEMIQDYENLLKIRDGLLHMMQEKKQHLEEQNTSLKDYILQMRDQLNLLSIDKSKKDQELKTMSMLLEEKTGYIDKIEERVGELEASVKEIKSKRVNLQEQISNYDAELRVTRDKISRLSKRHDSNPDHVSSAETAFQGELRAIYQPRADSLHRGDEPLPQEATDTSAHLPFSKWNSEDF